MNNAVRYRNRDYQSFIYARQEAEEEPYDPAGFWLRVVASIYDSLFLSLIAGLLTLAVLTGLTLAAAVFGPDLLRLAPRSTSVAMLTGPVLFTVVVFCAAHIGMTVFYGAAFEGSRLQATPGKLLLGLHVRDYDGEGLRFAHALKRNIFKYRWLLLCYAGMLLTAAALVVGGPCVIAFCFAAATGIIPLIVFLFDTLAVGFTKHKQAGYDTAAGCVVEKRPEVSFERRVLLSMIAVMLITGFVAYECYQRSGTGGYRVRVTAGR